MDRKLRVGADPFPPYQYYGGGGVRGSDYDKVAAAFRAAGYEIEAELFDWPEVEEKFNQGKYDACFQVQPTPDRLRKYIFSDLLREAATELVTSARGLSVGSYEEIAARELSLGVITGYTNGPEIDALPGRVKKAYPDAASLLAAISRGEVDLGVYDRGVKAYLMERSGIQNIYAIESMTFYRPLHVIFRDEALCRAFNSGLSALK